MDKNVIWWNFHEQKIMPACFIQTSFCKNFKFHPSLEVGIRSLKKLPTFYLEIIKYQEIISYSVWVLNSNINIDNKNVFISGFESKNIHFVGQIFHNNGKAKSWDYIKSEYNLERILKYRRNQLTDALLKLWKDPISNWMKSLIDLCIFDKKRAT